MYKYNIYIGKYDKDTKKQELTNERFLETIEYILNLFNIDCYTVYNCNGIYKHQDGTIISEPSLNIEYITKNNITEWACFKNKLRGSLNQESILITKQEIQIL